MNLDRWNMLHADLRDVLPRMADRSVHHVIADFPYSEDVHKAVRSAKRTEMPDVEDSVCRTRRTVDLGFDHLTPELRIFSARQFARLARRWVIVFCDVESVHHWRDSLTLAGLEYVRTCAWVRLGGAPQFSGDRPASGFEAIVCAHQPGRKRWNGGGKPGVYTCPIVQNRAGQRGSRVHPTQKPEGLMSALIEDFTDLHDIILDPVAGSGTTGVASVRNGRRFLGVENIESHWKTAMARIEGAS